MRQTATHVLILFLLSTTFGFGQQMWPGDANNNGVVNSVDLLYWGMSYGTSGTPRVNPTINWTGQNINSMWPESTPNGVNFVYADANGNGLIEDTDRAGAMVNNIGLNHGSISPDHFEIGSEANGDPLIRLFPSVSTTSPGNQLNIAINLGRSDVPVDSFYGIAIHLRYNPDQIQDGSFDFELDNSSWIGNFDPTIKSIVYSDDANGFAEIGITRTDHQDVLGGYGPFGMISMDVENMTDNQLPAILKVWIDSVKLITTSMQTIPVAIDSMNLQITNNPVPVYCPSVIAPVCGSNGVIYINSCYAEQAGIYNYTSGVCNPDCIDPAQINPSAVCPTVYEPVCGCNGVTYLNACEAEAAGVISYTSGPCNDNNCYDPTLVVTSDGATVNSGNGTITIDCPSGYDPVCGCNGITYDNACLAEANGITSYTAGSCDNTCIDPTAIDPGANCPNTYEPVCGCNGVTYPNACYAEAAGVLDYNSGTCGGGSSWCNEAVPVQCGDFLPNETNVGAGNNIITFPGCSGYTFYGPDKVYVINKTTAGDLQIGLEIVTPGLDLDMFLLAGNCSQTTCIGASTTSNNVTNNEGILYEDAPIGIYYLVVDGQFANSQGEYHLEINCGYLYCGDAQALNCGEPFDYNNMYGNDDVSLYGCDGNIYNVENNGPEIVHHFTITETGPVNISLTNLGDNLELFLLRSCDRGDCIDYSQNSGTGDEYISAYLDAGTYYVVVDGYNGAVSDYTLEVDCTSNCNLGWSDLAETDAECGQNNGAITLVSHGGQPGFLVNWTGPVSGSFTTFSNTCTISHLPPGTYSVTKTDANGCAITGTITIESIGNFSINANAQDAVCGQSGSMAASFYNGTGPFHVYLTGPSSTNFNTLSTNININDLPAGTYQFFVTDYYGCVASEMVTIGESSGNFSFNATPYAASCGAPGSIFVVISNGNPPYNYILTGPEGGNSSTNSSSFNLTDLPGGTYTLTIEDENWCSSTQVVSIENGGLVANVMPLNGVCGNLNALHIDIPNGTGPFVISYNGPISGQVAAGSSPHTIPNLPNGTYAVTVEGINDCDSYEVVALQNSNSNLQTELTGIDGTCGQAGSAWIDLNTGLPPYTIQWSGPAMGNISTNNDGINIPNLPAGHYTFSIADNSGCSDLQSVTIHTTGGVNMSTVVTGGSCGTLSSIQVNIAGGATDYILNWTGPQSGIVTINSDSYDLMDLPAGTYSIVVTDANGCSDSETVTISNTEGDDLAINALALPGWCYGGRIWLDIDGTGFPFLVEWTGPESGSATVEDIFGIAIQNLTSGTYTVQVTDANGCVVSEVHTIENEELIYNLIPVNPSCTQNGSITVQIMDGDPAYTIEWVGPVSGSTTTTDPTYVIPNLPTGTYNVTVTDNTLCSILQSVAIIEVTTVSLDPTPINGICGQNGAIWLDINNGSPDFTVNWTGPVNGSTTINSDGLNIPNLPSGAYVVSVVDANGCTDSEIVNINNTEDDLNIVPSPINGVCGQMGAIWLDINGGNAAYTITWTGPESGTVTINNDGYNIPNLPSGSYAVQVTDANGCDDLTNININNTEDDLNIVPSPIHGVCGQNGAIWLDINGGNAAYTITWTGPVNGTITINNDGYNIPNLPTGTYTVQVADVNGCSDVTSVFINNAPDDLNIVPTPINGVCGQNGAIWLDINGGTASYTITWTGPVNGTVTINNDGYNIDNLPTGTYTVQVSDVNGCDDVTSVYINNLPNDLNLVPSPINGVCGQNGAIWLDINGGTASYIITWTGPVNGTVTINSDGYNIDNLPSGTYTVQVTDANGCIDTISVTINNLPNDLDLVPSPINGVCGQNGAIWLDINGGTAAFTITWTGPVNGTIMTNSDGYNIPNLPSGTYTIQITDVNGCNDVISVNINNLPDDLDLVPTPINGVCGQNGAIWLDINGGNPSFTLTWTGPVNGTITINNDGYNIDNLPSGTYTIQVVDANGCDDVTSVTINNLPNDMALVATPTNGVCGQNGSILLGITGGTASFTITWTGPVNGTETINNNDYNIDNLPAGTYAIQVMDANGCDKNISATVTINPNPTVSVDDQIICEGEDIVLTANPSGGTAPYSYLWNTGGTSVSITVSPGVSTNYSVVLTDANGCTANASAFVDVFVRPIVTVSGDNPTCGDANGSITFTFPNEPDRSHLDFSIDGGLTYPHYIEDDLGSFTVNNLAAGFYDLRTRWGNDDCPIDLPNVNLVDESAPIVTISDDVTICEGGQATLIASVQPGTGTGAITYNWEPGSLSGASITVNPAITTIYTVTATDANGCTDSETVTVATAPNNLNLVPTPTNGTCGQNGSILLDISGGTAAYTITWTGPVNGTVSINSNSYNISNLSSGVYSITVTDANGCDDTTTATLNNTPDDLGVSTVVTNGLCDNLGSILVNITGGAADYTLNWTGPSNGTMTISGNAFSIPNLVSGAYSINVMDANGCDVATTASVNNTANNLGIILSADNGLCGQNGSIQVTITGGMANYAISWTGPSPGSSNSASNSFNIPNLPSGAYTINVTDANGCSNMANATINNQEDNLTLNTTITNALCAQAGSILLDITGGTPSYMISWTGPTNGTVSVDANNYTIPDLVGGTYNITVTDINGCDQTTVLSIGNLPDDLEVTPTVTNGTCGQNGSIGLNIVGGVAPYLISWTGPAMGTISVNSTAYNIPDLPSGTYSISITDSNGCSETIDVDLSNQSNDIALVLTPNNGACDHLGSIDISVAGGTAPYTINWSGPNAGTTTINGNAFSIPNTVDGTYTISVTDSDGCSADDSATIDNVNNDINLTVVPNNGVCGDLGSFTITVTGGTPNYAVNWTGPSNGSATITGNSHTATNAQNGVYTIDLTDANGCTQITTVTINNMPDQLDAELSVDNGLCGQTGTITVTINSGNPSYLIIWDGPVDGSTTTDNSDFTITGLTTGNYNITITDASGCDEVLSQIVANGANDLFSVPTLLPGDCGELGEIVVDIVGGMAPYTISWTGTDVGSTMINNNSYSIQNLATGNYNITVTDVNGCSDIDMEMLNNIPDNLDVVLLENDGICGELGSITINLFGGTPPFEIDWTGPTSGSTTININLHSLDNLPSGFYTVSVLDANGCAETHTATINNQENELQVSSTPSNGVCGENGSAQVSITGGTSPYSVTWTGPSNDSDNTNTGNYTINDLISGTYNLVIEDANGCATNGSFDLNNLEDDLDLTAAPINGVCGAEGEIQVSISGGTQDYTISWSGPESGSVTTSNNSFNIPNLISGSYDVSVTDLNGCDDTQVINLNNTEDDLDASASVVNGGCISLGYIWVDISGGAGPYTVTWTGPESGSQTITDISNGFTISDLVSGSYTINVEDPNGCSDAETATVNNLENDLAVNVSPTNGICDDLGSIQLSITGGDPVYIINWSGPVTGNTTTSNSSYNIPNLPSGNYTVAVTDENGCTEMEATSVNVGEGDLSLVATPFNGGCQGNGIIWVDVLGGTPSYTISWTGPSSGSTTTNDLGYHIPNLSSGTYQISVTDDNGCSENTSVIIDNTANLLSISATPINGICGPSGTIEIDINGGNPDYMISWSGPLNGSVAISDNHYTLSNLPSGSYTIVVMDSGGCVQIQSTTINNDESGDLEIVVNILPGGCGEFGSIWVNIYNGDPHFIITWIGPTSGNITTLFDNYDVFLPDGEYEIIVIDANGCLASEVVVITSILDDLEVGITPMNGQCNNSGSIGVDITGGTPEYTINWEDGSTSGSATTSSNYYEITDLPTGTYTVSITDEEGCLEVRYVPINNQNNGFSLSVTATPEDCSQEGSIDIQIAGGVPFYTITWTGPEYGTIVVPSANYSIPDLMSGTYDLSITDDNGCTATHQMAVGYNGQNPIADFTSNENDMTVSFTNYSAAGTYLWDFGDGNISTETNPTHTYSAVGSYLVCLTVTNGCGNDVSCLTANASLPPGAVLLEAMDMSGASGTTVEIPVTITNLDMLVSLAGSVGIVDPAVGTITGLVPGAITPLYNASLNTFNFYDNSGTGISVNDGDVLFYISVMLTGNAGDITAVSLTNNPLMIEVGSMQNGQPTVMSHVSLHGDLTIIGTGNLAGAITTFWGDGIPNVEVDVSTDAFSSMEMTDDLGNYDLPELPAGDMYYVEPALDTLPANGLSTFALFIGQRFILGMDPVEIASPYQIIAGDANCNGAFTTLDLFIIQQLIIGVSPAFASCPSWVFVAQHNNDMPIDFDSYNVFPYIDVDTLMLMQDTLSDFVGVKVGDILGAASPDPFAEEEVEERNLDELYLSLENRAVAAGELVEFEFRSNNFADIVSYQMGLSFDTDRLSFAEFIPGPNAALSNVIAGTNTADEGSVRISWFNLGGDATTVNDNEVLFTIRAYAQESIDDLEGLFDINSRYLRSEAHNGDTEPLDIVLELEESTTTSTNLLEETKYELYQNVPNPFKDRTIIGFDLPETMDVGLTIHDNTGRVLKRLDGRYNRGYNQVEIARGDLESGVYYYTLKTSTYSATRNMVVFE